MLLFKGGIATLACSLGYSKNRMDNQMDMGFLFCLLKSCSAFMFMVPPDCTSLQSPVVQEHAGALPHKGAQYWVRAGLPLLLVTREWLLFKAWKADFIQSQAIYLLQTYSVSIISCKFSGKMSMWDVATCIIWVH